jgi:hypothetical protein
MTLSFSVSVTLGSIYSSETECEVLGTVLLLPKYVSAELYVNTNA